MIDKNQLREAITEVLQEFGLYSPEAVDLLMGTAAVESKLGTYIRQIRGPALGIFQMEPASEQDLWNNFRRTKIILGGNYYTPDSVALKYDLRYQIIMARIHYLRKPGAIPTTLSGQANYWKKHYNTYLGAGTVEKYIAAWDRYVD